MTLNSTHLTGFNAVINPLVTTLISGATGTVFTDTNSTWSNPSNAFDANEAQTEGNSAAAASHGVAPSGYKNAIGKTWASAKTITQFTAISPTNSDFLGGGSANPTGWELRGSNSGSPSTTDFTTWTLLDSGTTTGDVTSNTLTRTASTINVTTAYLNHVFVLQGNGSNGVSICELKFYEDI